LIFDSSFDNRIQKLQHIYFTSICNHLVYYYRQGQEFCVWKKYYAGELTLKYFTSAADTGKGIGCRGTSTSEVNEFIIIRRRKSMMKPVRKLGGLFGLCLLGYTAWFCSSCDSSYEPAMRYNVPVGQFLFLEHSKSDSGVLIKGKWHSLIIDGPCYSFYPQTNSLRIDSINLPTDGTFFAVWGATSILTGCCGEGIGQGIKGLYSLPFEWHPLIPKLTGIAPGGRASFSYRDTTFLLAPGQEWSSVSTSIQTQDTSVAEITTRIRLVNHGYLSKGSICH
jgi:hypothetical protein